MSVKYYHLKVKNIIRETADSISVEFEQPENEKIAYKAGQFLTLILDIDNKKVRRAYSLCTSPVVDENPAVTIKKVQNGLVSNYLNDHLKVGDTIEIMEPMGQFTPEFPNTGKRHLILFGGGSGITPLMSIMITALLTEPETRVPLIFANRVLDSIIFNDTFDELQEKYPTRLEVVTVLEQAHLFWSKGHKGFLTTKLIRKILDNLPQTSADITEYYMCGPGPMMDVIEKAFAELKLPKNKLHKENFGLSPEEASEKKAVVAKEQEASDELKARKVKILYDGEEYVFEVTPDKTILETALSLDIDLPYSCQSGMCTACMGRCTSGKVKLDEEDALTPKELDQGYVLTCVGHPITDDVVIEIE